MRAEADPHHANRPPTWRESTVEQRAKGAWMRKFRIGAAIAAILACGATASAADLPTRKAPPPPAPVAPPPSGWQFTATLPLWATAIGGSVGVGRLPSANVNASFTDILKNLKGIFAGTFIARNDTFILGLDLLWSRVGTSVTFNADGSGPFANLRSGTSAKFTQDMTVGTAFAGYRIPIGTPDISLYGTAGARYMNLGLKVDLTKQFGGIVTGQPVGFSLTSSRSLGWVDPVIGFAMNYRINEKWFINAYGDIGGFGVSSKITTQGEIAVGYNWTPSVSTSVGFRALYDDYQHNNDNGGSFRYDATMYGPVVNLSYAF
jgi:hypothetical protein